MTAELGIPTVPPQRTIDLGNGIAFSKAGHHFTIPEGADLDALAQTLTAPLSVILQVTKRCELDCDFCSETLQKPDASLAQFDTIRRNLDGVGRVFLSGGEPMQRRDLGDIVDLFHRDFIVTVPTNAIRAELHAKNLVGKVASCNVGLEGPRAITSRVRGDYDKIMNGIRHLQDTGIPIDLSCVVYRSTQSAIPYLMQIADMLGAGKVKLIMPLRKGNALNLKEHEFLSNTEARELFDRVGGLRTDMGWTPRCA
ncbi:radical SAM protein [Streptacidiphilus monticola]